MNKYLMLFSAFLVIIFTTTCSQSPNTGEIIEFKGPKSEPLKMKIISVERAGTGSFDACSSSGYITILRSKDGRTDYWCGKWGKPGDEIAGYWHTGHRGVNASDNGFSSFE